MEVTGGGGPEAEARNRNVSAAVATIDPGNNDEVALIYARGPGPHTVPRAELWALFGAMPLLSADRAYTAYADAQYITNGMILKPRHIWRRVYDIPEDMNIAFRIVKSQIETQEQWDKYDMDEDGLVHNELADAVATRWTKHINRLESARTCDGKTVKDASTLIRYLAKVRARCWGLTECDEWVPENDRKQAEENEVDRVKRQTKQAIDSITPDAPSNNDHAHEIYNVGRWPKCRDCTGKALGGNSPYWN